MSAPKGHTLREAKYTKAVNNLVTDLENVPQKPATQDDVLAALKSARSSGLQAEAMGSGMQSMVAESGSSELIGVAIAAAVLLITFGSLVTAAAAIMISVFSAFILQSNSLIESMGFALAIAVFFDASVVRMTLIPAVMNLLGDRAWWLPKWLDKILPHVGVEGGKLATHLEVQPKHSDTDEDLVTV